MMMQLIAELNYDQEIDWMGVTVINQASADKKIPQLLDSPTGVRFVVIDLSALEGPIDLEPYMGYRVYQCEKCGWNGEGSKNVEDHKDFAICRKCNTRVIIFRGVDLVFCIGDLSPRRPASWFKNIYSQCQAGCIPIFDI